MTSSPHELMGWKRRSSVLVRGFSALELAIQAGQVPSGTTEEQFIQWIIQQATGAPGSTTVSPSWDIEGRPFAEDVYPTFLFDEDATLRAEKCIGRAKVAASIDRTMLILRNDETVGEIVWPAGLLIPTFDADFSDFDRGDSVTILPPAVQDATLSDLLITLSFERTA